MQAIFEKIAERENGTFHFSGDKNLGQGFSKTEQDKYQITFEYKRQRILVQNELGGQSAGFFLCKIPEHPTQYQFEIDERPGASKPSNQQSDYLILRTKHEELQQFITKSEDFKRLNQIAKSVAFQPLIQGRNRDGFFIIETRYHLAFEERGIVLEPMVDFYKTLIDYFDRELLRDVD